MCVYIAKLKLNGNKINKLISQLLFATKRNSDVVKQNSLSLENTFWIPDRYTTIFYPPTQMLCVLACVLVFPSTFCHWKLAFAICS